MTEWFQLSVGGAREKERKTDRGRERRKEKGNGERVGDRETERVGSMNGRTGDITDA